MGVEIRFTRRALAYIHERGWTEASTADHVRACVIRDWLDSHDDDDRPDVDEFDPADTMMATAELEPGASLFDEDDPNPVFWAVRGHAGYLEADLGRWVEAKIEDLGAFAPDPDGPFARAKTIQMPVAFDDSDSTH